MSTGVDRAVGTGVAPGPVRTVRVRTGPSSSRTTCPPPAPAGRGYDQRVVTCAFCDEVSPEQHPPLTWSLAVEQGRTKLFCEGCSRDNLRAMESKLDSDWW